MVMLYICSAVCAPATFTEDGCKITKRDEQSLFLDEDLPGTAITQQAM